jgi:membrane protease YdiL (CAAX protease family)
MTGGDKLKLGGVAIGWAVVARALAYYGVLLLPRSLASQLTLHSYLSLVLLVATALGVTAMRLWVPRAWQQLGLSRVPLAHVALGLSAGPLVLAVSAYLGFKLALPTLLAEIAAGGRRAAESNTGEFGRALIASHPATTLVWAVLLTPIAEELLFRGALWSAIQSLTARSDADNQGERSLPAELLQESAALRFLRGSWRWLLAGGIATVVSASIFAAMHADMAGGAGIVRVVQTACLGVALGIARHATGSIAPGVVLHAAFNLMTIAKLRKWITSTVWPHPLPIPLWWWQLAAVGGLALGGWLLYRRLRRS